uniref:lysine-specific demethylase 2B-like n=1 Tax=Styela clava TaxID=7725 RepID=UPI00193AC0BD|nr:lysine-specific demethylase 2B-like [Styela clava]
MAAVASDRNLRHKSLKVYDDEDVEDEIDGKRTFDVMEKIKSDKYNAECVLELGSDTFNFKYIQKNGFYSPVRFKEKDQLGMTLPDPDNFTITDIKGYVGGRRMLDVMECVTQRAMEMSMKDFAQYFEGTERKRIYNVISLEFSQTRLGPLVKRPAVVDKIDWIDLAWPPHLKYEQSEQTNKMAQMKYPKVQKYCLMSVNGCYTDFHVDFGGTSVWYHVLKGEKLFWLIPPTNKNLETYERWTKSGKQGDLFFGDLVDKCQRVHLHTGDSLMIPSGWIHAVYTPADSIVFGGNFLHSFNIPMQLRVAQLEERLHVPPRFRFPYFQEALWYTVERYVCNLTGQSFLTDEYKTKSMLVKKQQEDEEEGIKEETSIKQEEKKDHVHLTPYEYKGLVQLIESLEHLPKSKKFVPAGIENWQGLLTAAKQMLFAHSADDPELALTGEAIPCWPKPSKRTIKRSRSDDGRPVRRTPSAGNRVRRVRCKQCEACLRGDCGDCVYCKDMKKYGGPGTMKQSCMLRRCTNPLMPSTHRSDSVGAPDTPTPIQDVVENDPEPEEEEDGSPPPKKGKISRYRQHENGTPRTPRLEKVKISKDQSPLVPRVTIPRMEKKDLLRHVIRPVSVSLESSEEYEKLEKTSEEQIENDPTVDRQAWMQVFKRLPQEDLCRCMRVCKAFLRWCSSSSLWQTIDLSESPVTPDALRCIVRRTPSKIDLTRSYVSSEQLSWLIKRCPSLRNLVLVSNSWSLTASLCSANCPPLHSLNLSWVTGFTDSHLKQLISPPTDGRPGQQITQTRLRFLRHLFLTGTDVTNAGVSLIPSKLPHLHSIDLSYCSVTDKAIRCLITAANDQTCIKLNTIVAKSCPDITRNSLKHITEFINVVRIDFRDCCQITEQDCYDILPKLQAQNIVLSEPGLFVSETDVH